MTSNTGNTDLTTLSLTALFELYAEEYARLRELFPYQDHWRQIVAELGLETHDRILDACCGDGALTWALTKLGVPPPLVLGLDNSTAMLEHAAAEPYPSGRAMYLLSDLNAPPDEWAPAEFSAKAPSLNITKIALINGLYALRDPQQALAGLAQVVRPNTSLVLSTALPNPDMQAVLREHLEQVAAKGGDPAAEYNRLLGPEGVFKLIAAINQEIIRRGATSLHFLDEPTLRQMLDAAGWQVMRSQIVYAGQNVLITAKKR
ncbi:MAG TPA: methyltransferase domain-containing protein [Candidatus Saccharimonadia bacterium]|nr:methyltransferase domain-containing protein [Candidatus Saccharimonadia bacterium]